MIDWMKLGIKLQEMGCEIEPGFIKWDTNGGNSVFAKGDYAGHSINSLALAYAKRFGLRAVPTGENHN